MTWYMKLFLIYSFSFFVLFAILAHKCIKRHRHLMAFWLLFLGPGICSILLEVVTVCIVWMFSLLTI